MLIPYVSFGYKTMLAQMLRSCVNLHFRFNSSVVIESSTNYTHFLKFIFILEILMYLNRKSFYSTCLMMVNE